MVTESMVNDFVGTYYAALAGMGFKPRGTLNPERLDNLMSRYAQGAQPHIVPQYCVDSDVLQRRIFRCASLEGASVFVIERVTFLETPDGDVVVAVKAVHQSPGAISVQFIEIFIVAPEGEKLLVKQQAFNELAFVR